MVSKTVIGLAIIAIVVVAAISTWYILYYQPAPSEEFVLTFATTNEELASSIDPAVGSTTGEGYLLVQIYDPLFMPDPDNENEPMPWVVESYTVTTDGLKYTLKIRDGLKFHDGTAVTAEDIAFTMDRYLMMAKGFSYLWLGNVENGTSQVIDDHTVEFNLKTPSATFIASLTLFWVQNKDLILEHKEAGDFGEWGDLGQNWLAQETEIDVGSGPYKLEKYNRLELMELVRFDDYWQGWSENQVERVRILPVKEEATIKFGVAAGDYDLTDDWMSPQAYDELKLVDGVTVVERAASGVAGLFAINTQKPPLDDIHVRKAVAYAIDHASAVAEIYGGSQARGIVPPMVPGFNDDIESYSQNVTRALEELSQSQYSAEALAAFTIDVRYLVDQEFDRLFAILLQSNLADIGLNVEVLSWTFSNLVDAAQSVEATPHITLGRTFVRFPDADHFIQMMHSNGIGTWRGLHWWHNAEMDQLLEGQRAETDPAERQVILDEIQERIHDELPVLFIANPQTAVAMQDYVQGYKYTTDGYQFWIYRLTIEK